MRSTSGRGRAASIKRRKCEGILMTLLSLLRGGFVAAVLVSLLISAAGVVWIKFDIPGAWPSWLGPSEPLINQR